MGCWLPTGMGILPSFVHLFCSQSVSVMLFTSHSSFLRDIISTSSERYNTLLLLHLGAKAEKVERPVVSKLIPLQWITRCVYVAFRSQNPLVALSEDCKRKMLMAGNARFSKNILYALDHIMERYIL